MGYLGPCTPDETWDIRFVRGGLSAKSLGIDDGYAVSDSAYLVSKCYERDNQVIDQIGFMPHYVHARRMPLKEIADRAGLKYIDPQGGVENCLEALSRSRLVLCEAMHGAIVSDALGIPWIPVVIEKNMLEFKWRDWCGSINIEYNPYYLPSVWDYTGSSSIARLRNNLRKAFVAKKLKEISNKKAFLSESQIRSAITERMLEELSLL